MRPNVYSDRIVFLLQGVSGAGKTTLAKKKQALNEKHGVKTVIVSADDYFVQEDGSYVHDRERLPSAHADCFERFKAALGRAPIIIVDNTNTTLKQRQPYIDAAEDHYYEVVHILVGKLDADFIRFAAARSIHQNDVEHTKLVASGYQKPNNLVVVTPREVGFR